jgi:IS605 OrfB family transposase
MPITRAIKFAVDFEGVPRFSPAWRAWRKTLAAVEEDLRNAANRGLEAMYLMRRGAIAIPKKDDGKPVSVRTLSYQVFSGKWQPFGPAHGPLYAPTRAPRVSSRVLLGMAGIMFTRAKTDFASVEAGEVRLPVFRSLSIPTTADSLSFDPETFAVSFNLWGQGVDADPLPRLVADRLRGSQLDLLKKLCRGELKAGDARLGWDERKQKWMLSIAWTGPVAEVTDDRFAGIDLGQIVEVNIGYVDSSGDKLKSRDHVHFPEAALRAWDRIRKQYRQRQQAGVAPGDKLSRVVNTAIQQLAARVVQVVKQRRVGTLVLEDLRGFASDMFDETAELTSGRRAAVRAQWLRWHYGAVREQIKSVALREGLKVVVVEPGYTTMICSDCGKAWLGPEHDAKREKAALRSLGKLSGTISAGNTEVKQALEAVEVAPERVGFGEHGRHTTKHYSCSCGFADSAKLNAAWNIARRGRALLEVPRA